LLTLGDFLTCGWRELRILWLGALRDLGIIAATKWMEQKQADWPYKFLSISMNYTSSLATLWSFLLFSWGYENEAVLLGVPKYDGRGWHRVSTAVHNCQSMFIHRRWGKFCLLKCDRKVFSGGGNGMSSDPSEFRGTEHHMTQVSQPPSRMISHTD
jgi:hypothetical protein